MIYWCDICGVVGRATRMLINTGKPVCAPGHVVEPWPEAEAVFTLAGWTSVKSMAKERGYQNESYDQ